MLVVMREMWSLEVEASCCSCLQAYADTGAGRGARKRRHRKRRTCFKRAQKRRAEGDAIERVNQNFEVTQSIEKHCLNKDIKRRTCGTKLADSSSSRCWLVWRMEQKRLDSWCRRGDSTRGMSVCMGWGLLRPTTGKSLKVINLQL